MILRLLELWQVRRVRDLDETNKLYFNKELIETKEWNEFWRNSRSSYKAAGRKVFEDLVLTLTINDRFTHVLHNLSQKHGLRYGGETYFCSKLRKKNLLPLFIQIEKRPSYKSNRDTDKPLKTMRGFIRRNLKNQNKETLEEIMGIMVT